MTAPLRKGKDLDLNEEKGEINQGHAERSESSLALNEEPIPLRPALVESERMSPTLEASPSTNAKNEGEAEGSQLFPRQELRELQDRWDEIQANFVDQPRNAVGDADALVSSAIRRLAEIFEAQHAKLEQQWSGGDHVSTEELRRALQQYRAFFHRVLSI
jgi:hypothetical protein